MKTTYKHWMLGHVAVLIVNICWLVILLVIGHESKHPFNIYLTLQAILSIILWALISKRLFLPAFYLACAVVAAATFNFHQAVNNLDFSHISVALNEIYHYVVYFCVAIFCFTLYVILAYYPYKVMKTAKKIGLA